MTTTIDGTNVSTFAEGVTCTALNGGQLGGRRNLVMNGEMKVAQRTASTAGLGADAMTRVLDSTKVCISCRIRCGKYYCDTRQMGYERQCCFSR